MNNLWLTDLSNITTSQILPPPSLHGEAHFSHVTWADEGQKYAVTWFNRVQNESVITLCDVSDLDCSSHEIFKRVSFTIHKIYGNLKLFLYCIICGRLNVMHFSKPHSQSVK